MKWFRKAAEQGDAQAQNNLGTMYGQGHGVAQNDVQARMWFDLAATKGDAAARTNRDIAAGNMTPAQVAQAERLARECKPKER